MTDRYDYLIVALEKNTRTDDAQPLISAISMLHGVLKVEPHIADPSQWTVEERVRRELGEKLWAVLYQKKGG